MECMQLLCDTGIKLHPLLMVSYVRNLSSILRFLEHEVWNESTQILLKLQSAKIW